MRRLVALYHILFAAVALFIFAAPSQAQIGACCQGNGACINTDQRGCSSLSGTFLGAGTSCATSNCTGACCLPGGGCSVVSPNACTSKSGTFQGLGSSCATHCSGSLGNSFSYQGRLLSGGEPVNGSVVLDFKLFDTGIGGLQVGPTITANDIAVADGLFTIDLDFGDPAQSLDGNSRWLEVTVNTSVLAPRQRVTAVPYALHATYSATTRGIHVGDDGNVGVGTNAPAHHLHVDHRRIVRFSRRTLRSLGTLCSDRRQPPAPRRTALACMGKPLVQLARACSVSHPRQAARRPA